MMNNINQSLKHMGLWAIAPQCSVLAAFEGNYSTPTSIRGFADQRMLQGFIGRGSYN